MAKNAHYSTQKAELLLDEMLAQVDPVIEKVKSQLSKDFPATISQPIFDGMKTMKDRLQP